MLRRRRRELDFASSDRLPSARPPPFAFDVLSPRSRLCSSLLPPIRLELDRISDRRGCDCPGDLHDFSTDGRRGLDLRRYSRSGSLLFSYQLISIQDPPRRAEQSLCVSCTAGLADCPHADKPLLCLSALSAAESQLKETSEPIPSPPHVDEELLSTPQSEEHATTGEGPDEAGQAVQGLAPSHHKDGEASSEEEEMAAERSGSQSAAFNEETGEINWDCPVRWRLSLSFPSTQC